MPSHEVRPCAEMPWKVVIVGGFGCVGRQIARDLCRHLGDEVEITLAGRHPDSAFAESLKCRTLKLDVSDACAAALVAGFDFVVNAAGPTRLLGARVAALCIEAGVSCLDINDAIDATVELLALHDEARARGVDLFTGFGLLPGLSTLLLLRLLEQQPAADDGCRVRLYMGAKTAGGPASSHVLSAAFRQRVACVEGGTTAWRNAVWSGSGSRYRFPGMPAPVGTLPFSSPEAVTVPLYAAVGSVPTLDVRYHVQFLPTAMARLGALLARCGCGWWGDRALARLMRASAPSAARRRKSSALTSLVAERGKAQCQALTGEYPAPALTAAFASAATLRILRDEITAGGGVWPFESVYARLPGLAKDLATRGIIITDGPEWEASSPADGTPQGLRNFGRCWYDAEVPHEIQARQLYLLRSSELWSALRSVVGRLRRPVVMLGFVRRWRKAYIETRNFLIRNTGRPSRAIARDMAMFAAGYGLSRELLGRERAYALYRAMFLDTGAMEMNWLWPSSTVFAVQPDAKRIFLIYVAGYFEAYRRLGIYQFSQAGDAARLELTVTRCLLSEIFAEHGVAELASLIRQMEIAAIDRHAKRLGCEVAWTPDESGALGSLTLTTRAEECMEVL
ncbi:MAG: saccharopine dehydrogenase NADP-binding domain-containing protein [Hyphomicrobiaceae bacterium]